MFGSRALIGMVSADASVRYVEVAQFYESEGNPTRTMERWSSGEFGGLAVMAFGDLDHLDATDLSLASGSDRAPREAPDADGFHAAARECGAVFAALYERGTWRGWAIPPEGLKEALDMAAEETERELEYVRRSARGFDAADHAPERQARKLRAAARVDAGLARAALRLSERTQELIGFRTWSHLYGSRTAIHLLNAESRGIGIAQARESLAWAENDAMLAVERIGILQEQVARSLRGEPLWAWPPGPEGKA